MKVVVYLLGACVALAALQTAAALVMLIIVAFAGLAMVFHPRETLGVILILAITHMVFDRPVTLVAILGVLLVGILIAKAIDLGGRS